MKPTIHTKTYIFTFIATIGLFVLALIGSTYITRQKTEQLKADESRLAIDILSLETQYELLNESSCKTFSRASLRSELDELASKLNFIEGQVSQNDPEVSRLKRYYSILQIRDYLLTKRMAEECENDTIFILYFYANKNCPECTTQDYMLKAVRNLYPQVEVYSFDYHLDLSAVKTLINLHNIPPAPPVIDINGKIYPSFSSLEALREVIDSELATSTATSTKTTSTKSNR